MSGSRRLSIEIVGDAKGAAAAFGQVEGAAASMDQKTQFSFKGFKGALDGAEGASGKFAAGMDFAKEHAGALALAGGTALVGFAVKSLGAFQDMAQGAKETGLAIGANVEDTSRWIAIADDAGVSADAFATAAGKIPKSLDQAKWKQYGIDTRDAAGNVRDTTAVFEDSLIAIGNLSTEQARAKAGTDLFGKSWAQVAPLVGKTRAEYDQMLGSVEKGQVITAQELQKSEDMRKAQDALHDALQEVSLAVGQQVAQLAPLLSGLASAVTEAQAFYESLDKLPRPLKTVLDGVQAIANPLVKGKDLWDDLTTSQDIGVKILGKLGAAHVDVTGSFEHMGVAAQDSGVAVRNQSIAMADAAAAAGQAKRDTDNLKASWDTFMGSLSQKQSLYDLEDSFSSLHEKALLAYDAASKGAGDAGTKQDDYNRSLLDTETKVANYAHALGGLPLQQVTDIVAAVDNGSITTANQILDRIARDRQVIYNAQVSNHREYAIGTNSAAAGLALVGERGPELVAMAGGERVFTAERTAAMLGAGGGGGVTVIVQGSIVREKDLHRSVADGLIDMVRRGVLPAGAFG